MRNTLTVIFAAALCMAPCVAGTAELRQKRAVQSKKAASNRVVRDRFADNDNGTITDSQTGLMWLADANVARFPLPWEGAKQYIDEMNGGVRQNYGYTDWRLPTLYDLSSLIDSTQSNPALPLGHPFQNLQNELYWSSTTITDIVDYAWAIDMATGNQVTDTCSYCSFWYFWPVRNTWRSQDAQQGTVFSGGTNNLGQLGDGTAGDHPSFSELNVLKHVVRLAAGERHALALTVDGIVWAWGDNSEGQLGVDSHHRVERAPVAVQGIQKVTDVAAGESHSLAVRSDGSVWAWGNNDYDQLGGMLKEGSGKPVQVKRLSQITKVSASADQSFALKSDGTVWAWGRGLSVGGQAVQMRGLSQVVMVSAGKDRVVALRKDGTVWTVNTNPRSGFANTSSTAAPQQVQGLSRIVEIAAGCEHSLALRSDGAVLAWGGNEFMQLGTASVPMVDKPIEVESLKSVRKVAAGAFHSVAILADGTISYWGKDMPSVPGRVKPYAVNYLKNAIDISAGKYFTLVLVGEEEAK